MTSNKDTNSDKNTSSTYVSDTRYRSVYNPSLNPVNIHYIAALNGYKHGPLEGGFHYLDMGCGDGTTLNVLAGLFPDAHFTGIDFNKEHIRIARVNASAAGFSNVVFHELDFLNMDENAFPDFDFIVCYGTFSWIGGALQDAVCNFAGDKLKQNGLFLIHFAARPGKVQIDPLWHLMRSVPADKFSNSTDRARYGINLICSLKNRGSQFFRQNPLALARANSLENQDLHYVAHEALTEWQALNHSDIVTRMSGVGLSFAGSINPEDNHMETCVPETFRGLVEEAENIGIKETVIDYVLNRGIRTDIFIKSTLPNDRRSPTIEDIPLGLLNKDNYVQREFKFSSGLTISYDNQIYADIALELANGAMTINNLNKTNRMVRYRTEDIQHAIQMLVAGKQIKPFKKSFSVTRTTAAPGRLKPATHQIDHILRSRIDMNEMIFLPNKLSGQCMELEPQVALILSALVYERKEGALQWILNQLGSAEAIKVGTGQTVSAAQISSMVLERIEWVKKVVLSTMVGHGFFIEEG